jgi:2-C-methyl-D-erythritol 4-phosphate cytidylyltransferase
VSTCAILLCAGRGERLGADIPKAMVPLAGRPLFAWSLLALQASDAIDAIVMVGQVFPLQHLVAASGISTHKIVAWIDGGTERQHSVGRGLAAVPAEHEYVAVHDCARALVSADVIARAVAAAHEHGAAIAAVPLADTLKQVDGTRIVATVPRAGLWCAQTPQVFRRDWLSAAHQAFAGAGVLSTDDARLVEEYGFVVHVVQGDAANFKITTAGDLALAEALLAQQHGG